MHTMQERPNTLDTEEGIALAGMLRRGEVRVPSVVFEHPGMRAWVEHWERVGVCRGTDDIAAVQAFAGKQATEEALGYIDAMDALGEIEVRFRDACSDLVKRHKLAYAMERTAKVQADFDKGFLPAGAVAEAYQQLQEAQVAEVPIKTAGLAFKAMIEEAKKYQGKAHLGLSVRTTPLFSDRLDGFRGLGFMGGVPGTGKTSLAVQWAMDAAETNKDAVVVVLTCEMSANEVMAMTTTRLTGLHYLDLMRGTENSALDAATGLQQEPGEIERLNKAQGAIEALKERFLVVTPEHFGGAFLGRGAAGHHLFAPVLDMIRRAQEATGATRSMLVVDSMQSLPIAEPESGSVTGWRGGDGMERDRYTIAGLNALTSKVDAVLVVSEQAKGTQGQVATTNLLGTGRSGYAADFVIMLSDPDTYANTGGDTKGDEARAKHYKQGYRLVYATLAKGRAGMNRGAELLSFKIHEHKFEEGAKV
jgi:replicative DNA helicase